MDDILAWLPAELAPLPHYVVAMAIGLLMGLERERNPAAKAARNHPGGCGNGCLSVQCHLNLPKA